MDLGYAGLKCTQLEGNKFELDWTGADFTEWTGPHVSGVDWTGLNRTALQKTELDGMHFTGLDCLILSLTSPDCTTLD